MIYSIASLISVILMASGVAIELRSDKDKQDETIAGSVLIVLFGSLFLATCFMFFISANKEIVLTRIKNTDLNEISTILNIFYIAFIIWLSAAFIGCIKILKRSSNKYKGFGAGILLGIAFSFVITYFCTFNLKINFVNNMISMLSFSMMLFSIWILVSGIVYKLTKGRFRSDSELDRFIGSSLLMTLMLLNSIIAIATIDRRLPYSYNATSNTLLYGKDNFIAFNRLPKEAKDHIDELGLDWLSKDEAEAMISSIMDKIMQETSKEEK